jgi:hypothetical protein
MMPKFFAHNCPTINATAEVNHFAHPEFSRLGGFSAESEVKEKRWKIQDERVSED